jgi:hypothetical protein
LRLPTKTLYAFLISSIHDTGLVYLIFLDLLLIKFIYECELLNCLLCSLLQPSVTSTLFRGKHSSQHPALKHPKSISLICVIFRNKLFCFLQREVISPSSNAQVGLSPSADWQD